MKSITFYLRVGACLAATIPVKSEIFHRKGPFFFDYDQPSLGSTFNPLLAQDFARLQSTLHQGSRTIPSPPTSFNNRPASSNLASSTSRHTVSTVTNLVPFAVPQPFPIHITRTFPTPVYVGVPYDVPRPVRVSVPHIVPFAVPRAASDQIPRTFLASHGVPNDITQDVDIPVGIQVAHVPLRIPHPHRESFYIPGAKIPNSPNFPDYAQPLYNFHIPPRHDFK